jgi:hypothetical protein
LAQEKSLFPAAISGENQPDITRQAFRQRSTSSQIASDLPAPKSAELLATDGARNQAVRRSTAVRSWSTLKGLPNITRTSIRS